MSKNKKPRAVLLTPVVTTSTVDLADTGETSGLLFRKKILPEGTISYPDPDSPAGRRKVTFDRAYHTTLINAFRDKAVECPTVQLADERNGHNMDLLRTAGAVQDLDLARPDDVDGPGLYAVIKARNEEHARLLREMPGLGVSAQIKERVERVDGKKFPAALRHVLVTADPRVVGMGPWRPVSLSADDGPVIDLSDDQYDEEMGSHMGELQLSDDEIEAALAAAADLGDPEADDEHNEKDEHDVDLSDSRSTVLDLAARLEDSTVTLTGVQAKLAAADWKGERLSLSNAGVPKVLLDAAEKVLKFPGENVLSLSDEDGRQHGVDARSVIREMLEAARGIVDLSDKMPGSSAEPPIDLSEADQANEKAFLDSWASRSGF